MDYISTATRTHAIDFWTRERVQTPDGWRFRATSYCGRTVTGTGGACIAAMIDCGSCQRLMDPR